jgi:hypothetical protein
MGGIRKESDFIGGRGSVFCKSCTQPSQQAPEVLGHLQGEKGSKISKVQLNKLDEVAEKSPQQQLKVT